MSSLVALILIIGSVYGSGPVDSECGNILLDGLLDDKAEAAALEKTQKSLNQAIPKQNVSKDKVSNLEDILEEDDSKVSKLMRRFRNWNDNELSSTFMKDEEGLWPVLQSLSKNLRLRENKRNTDSLNKAEQALNKWVGRTNNVTKNANNLKAQLTSLDKNILALEKLAKKGPIKYPLDLEYLAIRKGLVDFDDIGDLKQIRNHSQFVKLQGKLKRVRNGIVSKNGKKGKLPDLFREQAMDRRRLTIIGRDLYDLSLTLNKKIKKNKDNPKKIEMFQKELSVVDDHLNNITNSLKSQVPTDEMERLRRKELLREFNDLTKTVSNNYDDLKNSSLLKLAEDLGGKKVKDAITSGGSSGGILSKVPLYSLARKHPAAFGATGATVNSLLNGKGPLEIFDAIVKYPGLKFPELFGEDHKEIAQINDCIQKSLGDEKDDSLRDCIATELKPMLDNASDATAVARIERLIELATDDAITKKRERLQQQREEKARKKKVEQDLLLKAIENKFGNE